MKTVLRLSLGLLLAASLVGCHTCGQQSCLHKIFDNGCGCHDNQCGGDACGCNEGVAVGARRVRTRRHVPVDATMHGYGNSVVYTGDDWQGIPQPAMGQMPMMGAPSGGNCGCSGGMPGMAPMPSSGCAGCGAPASIPSQGGGCASCAGGNHIEPQHAPGGCASCGGAPPTSMTPTPVSSGGCASCGAGAANESFFGPSHQGPAPAPPAEGIPGQNIESSPGDKAANQGESIQKIHWVPRQL